MTTSPNAPARGGIFEKILPPLTAIAGAAAVLLPTLAPPQPAPPTVIIIEMRPPAAPALAPAPPDAETARPTPADRWVVQAEASAAE